MAGALKFTQRVLNTHILGNALNRMRHNVASAGCFKVAAGKHRAKNIIDCNDTGDLLAMRDQQRADMSSTQLLGYPSSAL